MLHWFTIAHTLLGLTLGGAGAIAVMAVRDKYKLNLMWEDYKKRHHIDGGED